MDTVVEMASLPAQFSQPKTMVMEVVPSTAQNTIANQLVAENSVTAANSAIFGVLANSQHGQGVFTTTQTGASIVTPHLQSVVKRPLSSVSSNSAGGHVVTKVIITKNPGSNQPHAIPTLTAGSHAQSILIPAAQNSQSMGSITPTKTVTISQGGILSPTKLLATTLPTTPTKQVLPLGSKLTLSPMKTPQKITMIPISGKSPQRIIPSTGQLMIAKSVVSATSGSSTVTMATAKQGTITLSPSSKVIFKQQQPGVQTIAKGSVVAQQLNTGSQPGSSLPFATVAGMQPLSVSGSKFQYVRLVTAASPQVSQNVHITKTATIAPAPFHAKPIAPAQGGATGPPQMKITMPLTQQQVLAKAPGAMVQSQQPQRILLPATSQVGTRLTGSTAPSLATIQSAGNSLSGLPPGTTIISSGQNLSGVQGFALVPAQYVQQIQQMNTQQPQPQTTQRTLDSNFSALAGNNLPSTSRHSVNGSLPTEPAGQRPRKPCNCTKSQCLKLYCDCFANGEFCHNCNCSNCANNLEHEDERSRAIKACLDRNPLAFHPKIGKGKHGEGDRRHNKGCNCKRSGCLKNYCECYEAKILCSSSCKCVGCKNFEESPDRKTLMHLADAAEVRVQQQTAAKTKLSSQIQDVPPRPPPPISGERLPYTFVTHEVAEATCACLVAQAEESERTRQMEIIQERLLLEEFGRCLMQVIESASKTKAPSPVP